MVPGYATMVDSMRLIEAVKSATNITGQPGIRTYFLESSSILGFIFRLV